MAQIREVVTSEQALRLAMFEAQKGKGFVSSNPLVGCTIVDRDHKVISVGYHPKAGHQHAEIDALRKITDLSLLEGATVYVTLEPCAHVGKTGSCAVALSKLPIKRVVYGLVDPFPLVAGKGAQILRDAGIEAVSVSDAPEISNKDTLVSDLEDLAEIFLHNVLTSEPFFAIKVATGSDGMMALKTGGQVWITGEEAREQVQRIRLAYDAVLIGRNTFETDDPSLNIRLSGVDVPVNTAVILDPAGKSLLKLADSKLLKVRPPAQVFVVVKEDYVGGNPSGVRVLKLATEADGSFSARKIAKLLWDEGVRSVLVEGGAETFKKFLSEDKVQKLYHFASPKVIGDEGIHWLGGAENKFRFKRCQVKKFGDDTLVYGPLAD